MNINFWKARYFTAVGNGCQSKTVYPEDARTWNNLIRKQDTLKKKLASWSILTDIYWQIYFDLKGDESGE